MAIKIRPIVLNDAASYSAGREVLAKEGRYSYESEAPPASLLRARIRKNLRLKNPMLVAVDGERVVGWAGVYRAGIPSLSHGGDLVMSVLPEYRGRGLGTKLASGVLKMARGEFEMVILAVFGKNRRAQKFFKSQGFAPCGKEKKAVKLAYGFDDVVIMQKQIRR